MVMVHGVIPNLASRAPDAEGGSPVVIYLYLQDMDAAITRAVEAGARVLIPAPELRTFLLNPKPAGLI